MTTSTAQGLPLRLQRLARLMDANFRVPGTQIRFGLDPLIGLIPGIGDGASLLLSAYIVYEARRLNIPRRTMARMVANVLLDSAVGTIPVVGDLFDVAYKSNLRNIKLMEDALERRRAEPT